MSRHVFILIVAMAACAAWQAGCMLARWRQPRQALDLAWRPWHLRHARLAYAEELFRCEAPIHLVAKVDRAYRAGGLLHLVELKTRRQHRVYRYDVIELSAQRVAILGDTGEAVADIAYVLTRTHPDRPLKRHRVSLMSPDEIAALARRRDAILAHQLEPWASTSPALCRKCAYVQPCGRAARSAPHHGRPVHGPFRRFDR